MLAAIGLGSRVLEIGPGTGRATRPLASLGAEVTAVELGANLARVAARELADLRSVTIVKVAFEDWPLPPQPFDAVVVATAWHWLDSAVSWRRVEEALRPGGHLGIISTHHVNGGTRAFFTAVQECYVRWDGVTQPGYRLPEAAEVPTLTNDLSATLTLVSVTRYETELDYSADECVDLLLTYSDHRDLEPRARDGLLDCIHGLITREFGGKISKRYLPELSVFRPD